MVERKGRLVDVLFYGGSVVVEALSSDVCCPFTHEDAWPGLVNWWRSVAGLVHRRPLHVTRHPKHPVIVFPLCAHGGKEPNPLHVERSAIELGRLDGTEPVAVPLVGADYGLDTDFIRDVLARRLRSNRFVLVP